MERNRPKTAAPTVIHTSHPDCLGLSASGFSGVMTGWTSVVWLVANKAYFYPFTLYDWATVYQLFWWVGGVSAGNIDVGIYDAQKNLVVSAGTTAMSATLNTVQLLNVTDTVLPPGQYLLAGVGSNITGTCFGGAGQSDEIALSTTLIYEQASAIPLPDPCTPVICTDATMRAYCIGAVLTPTF